MPLFTSGGLSLGFVSSGLVPVLKNLVLFTSQLTTAALPHYDHSTTWRRKIDMFKYFFAVSRQSEGFRCSSRCSLTDFSEPRAHSWVNPDNYWKLRWLNRLFLVGRCMHLCDMLTVRDEIPVYCRYYYYYVTIFAGTEADACFVSF